MASIAAYVRATLQIGHIEWAKGSATRVNQKTFSSRNNERNKTRIDERPMQRRRKRRLQLSTFGRSQFQWRKLKQKFNKKKKKRENNQFNYNFKFYWKNKLNKLFNIPKLKKKQNKK